MEQHPVDLADGLAPGERVGAYRIVRQAGRGGMATVWLARDEKHDRDVAVKVLRADLAASIGRSRTGRSSGCDDCGAGDIATAFVGNVNSDLDWLKEWRR